jgi:hypothetical protein
MLTKFLMGLLFLSIILFGCKDVAGESSETKVTKKLEIIDKSEIQIIENKDNYYFTSSCIIIDNKTGIEYLIISRRDFFYIIDRKTGFILNKDLDIKKFEKE